MKIEWASHFNPDGTRRRPPPSSMHGWLAKMRGTLIGNEELRSRGMREMREAAARKKRHAEIKRQHAAATGKSIFSVFGFGGSGTRGQVPRQPRVLQQHSRPSQSRRTTHDSSRSGYSSRPQPRPSGTSNRPGQRRRTQDSYVSQSGQRRSSRR